MADAFFRFGTDIEQTAAQIRAGMQQIAQTLASTRSQNVRIFDPIVEAATKASAEANRQLAKVGNTLAQGIEGGSVVGGGRQLRAQYQEIRRQQPAQVEAQLSPVLDQLGITGNDRRRLLQRVVKEVGSDLDALYRDIAQQAAEFQGLTVRQFNSSRPERGLPNEQRRLEAAQRRENERAARDNRPAATLTPPPDVQKDLRGRNKLTEDIARTGSADTGARPDPLFTPNPTATGQKARALLLAEEEAHDIHRNFLLQRKEDVLEEAAFRAQDAATRKSIERQLREVRREQMRVGRERAKEIDAENKALAQRQTFNAVMADPTMQALSGGRFLTGAPGQQTIFNTRGEGLEVEKNLGRIERAKNDAVKAVNDAVAKADRELRQEQEQIARELSRQIAQDTAARVQADPSARRVNDTRWVTDTGAYNVTREGMELERGQIRAENARRRADQQDEARQRREQEEFAARRSREIEQETMERVLADPTQRRFGPNRFTTKDGVYNVSRFGMEMERSPFREDDIRQAQAEKMAADQERRNAQLIRRGRGESLSQSFFGGLTSGGFGGGPEGVNGLARSFGNTVKFNAQYEALMLTKQAFVDTIREAVDYKDSLTDLNVALGEGNEASAAYVDQLSNISRAAGGNVGQALDSATRGIRAFGPSPGDAALPSDETDRIGLVSAEAARDLSIITGQSIPDAMGDLVAIGQSFDLTIDGIGRVTDAVAAAKQAGGDPNQIAQGLANAAVALNEAGFDTAEGAMLMSSVIANLNESGQAAATRISRIVSSAGSTSGRQLFRSLDIDPNGSAKDSLIALAKLYNENEDGISQLTDAQKQQALATLGGGSNLREFRAALAALEMDGFAEGFDTAGKAQDEVTRKTQDLAGRLKSLQGTISNLQNELFDSGAFAPFLAALGVLEPILNTAESLLKIFNQFADVVLPDWSIMGVGIQDAIVGALEIVAAQRLIAYWRRKGSDETLKAAALEAELKIAKDNVARASAQEATGEQTALRAHQAAVVAIEQEILALNALSGAKGRAAAAGALGAGGIVGGVGGVDPNGSQMGRTGRAGSDIGDKGVDNIRRAPAYVFEKYQQGRDFMGTGMGKGLGIATAVITATQAVQALTGAIQKDSDSRAGAALALEGATYGKPGQPLDEGMEALRAEAEARRKSADGWFGTPINWARTGLMSAMGRGDEWGVNANEDARRLDIEADIMQARAEQRRKEQQDRNETVGRYDDAFGGPEGLNSLEQLKASFDALDAKGASAARTLDLLAGAMDGLGDEEAPGFVAKGASGRVADEIAGGIFEDVAESTVANVEDEKRYKRPIARPGSLSTTLNIINLLRGGTTDRLGDAEDQQKAIDDYIEQTNDEIKELDKDDRKKALKDAGFFIAAREGQRELDPEDEQTRGSAERRLTRDVNMELARKRLDKIPGFEPGMRQSWQRDISSRLEQFFDKELGEGGGFLDDGTIERGATEIADWLIGDNKELQANRDTLIREIENTIKERTTAGGWELTQEAADALTPFVIQRAATRGQDMADLEGDTEGGARKRLEELDKQIQRYKDSNLEENDSLLAERRRAELDLEKVLVDKAAAYNELAKAQNGRDDAVSNAQLDVALATRRLAAAEMGGKEEEINAAKAAEIAAQVAEADARRTRTASARTASVGANDAVGAATADYLNARDTRLGTDQFDDDGAVNAAYSDAMKVEADTFLAVAKARVARANALADSQIGVGNYLGQATTDLNAAQAELKTIAQFDSEGQQTEEYSNKLKEIAELAAGEIEAQVQQTLNLALSAAKAGDSLAQARARANASALLLSKTPKYDANGQLNGQWLDREVAASADAYAVAQGERRGRDAARGRGVRAGDAMGMARKARQDAADAVKEARQFGGQTEIDEALEAEEEAVAAEAREYMRTRSTRRARGTSARNELGNLRNAVNDARDGVALARQFGGEAEINAALEVEEEALLAYADRTLAIAQAIRRANTNPLDERAQLRLAVQEAQENLDRAIASGADPGEIANLRGARDQARIDQVLGNQEIVHAERMARIDPRDSVARTQEAARQATERVNLLRSLGASGVQMAGALQGMVDAQIAAAEAILARHHQQRRLGIDLTNPLENARLDTLAARERLENSVRTGAPQEQIDADTLALREAQNNEEQVAFQQRFSQAQTNERLGRISHAAYIEYLNNEKARLEAIAERTYQQQQQLDQVDEALQAARDSMQGQFNLGDIDVPTPFEVRRSLEAEGGAITTQSTAAAVTSAVQNVEVTINGADLVQVKNLITSLIGPQASGRTPVVAGRKV